MKTDFTIEKPEAIRPILHDKIDQMDAQTLTLIHRVLLQIEAERLAAQLVSDLDKDEGFFDRIQDAIKEFRKKHPYQ